MNYFPRYWPFVMGIHLSKVDAPHEGPAMQSFVFFFFDIIQIHGSTNSRVVGDLRRINELLTSLYCSTEQYFAYIF